jgi:hypothetical protein
MALAPPLTAGLERRLRSLSGLEEEIIAANRMGHAAELCNELVARCLTRPGADPSAARREVEDMLVCERDLALIAVRWRTFGSNVDLEVSCPQCEERHHVDIELDRMPAPALPPRELTIDAAGARARVRLPTTRDQAQVLASCRGDIVAGRDALLAATLVELDGNSGPFSTADVEALAPEVRDAIDAAVESALPDLDLGLTASCPA